MKKNRFHVFLFISVIGFLIWSSIKPSHYPIWILEVGPSVIILIVVLSFYKKVRLTTLSYFIIALLTILTFIGGHYTYDDVPWFDWLQDQYDLKRNDYDRFGHFMKGLVVIVFREILLIKTSLTSGKWVQFLAFCMTLTVSASYEIIEWLAAQIARRKTKDFVGAQGDIWDAQWDMSLTLIGSIIALWLFTRWHNRLIPDLKEKHWS
ncbi:hypothetical protein AWM68_06960 [Fictibacillus phosphorivorans]|uniref:DUF2238 domain-containing protein n=1 Tax=Fictibacillus phosphorivorans TaxID=1221500 RepID=A0A165NHS2_9BACL|nr:DUF2238 domain-containing protein [Fictibacillus phosphorivorans]KZE66110.1 hypothetical protein AWM68_06960 [Fictibacillus phosphorivorans]